MTNFGFLTFLENSKSLPSKHKSKNIAITLICCRKLDFLPSGDCSGIFLHSLTSHHVKNCYEIVQLCNFDGQNSNKIDQISSKCICFQICFSISHFSPLPVPHPHECHSSFSSLLKRQYYTAQSLSSQLYQILHSSSCWKKACQDKRKMFLLQTSKASCSP